MPNRNDARWPGAAAQRAALAALAEKAFTDHRLILASNRGPMEFDVDPATGGLGMRRGQGGLVTALNALLDATGASWIACALGQGDRAALERAENGVLTLDAFAQPLRLRLLSPPDGAYAGYYDAISNAVLWFVQHGIVNSPVHPSFDMDLWRAWDEGYVRVNALFAEALAAEADCDARRPLYLIQDYHLYLVPAMLREARPDAHIQHFTHIAWPAPDAWRILPGRIRESLLTGMLGADVVGFHCERYAVNFLLTVQDFLGATIDLKRRTIAWEGREVKVRAYPIAVDPLQLGALAESPAVVAAAETLRLPDEGKLVLQIARTDPSKNILRTFYAFEIFLANHPEWIGVATLLGLLPASRQTTEVYKEYFDELQQVAVRINADYGTPDWTPIHLHFENDYPRAIAALKRYDALVVNSIADGMNLVAKEGPIVNERAGALLLSEGAGAAEELHEGAWLINPFDLVGMAEALHEALACPPPEREARQRRLRRALDGNTIFRWAHDQIATALEAERRSAVLRHAWAPEAHIEEVSP